MDVPSPEAGTVKEVLVSSSTTRSRRATPILVLEGGESRGRATTEDDARRSRTSDREAEADHDDGAEEERRTKRTDAKKDEGDAEGAGGDEDARRSEAGLPDAQAGAGSRGRLRARRLHGRVPRRRSWPRGDRWSSATSRSAASASTSAASPRRRCSTRPRSSPRPRTPPSSALRSASPRSISTSCARWKEEVVGKLTGGLDGLAKQRKVEVVTGEAQFTSDHDASTSTATSIAFEHCILAAGSRAAMLPDLPDDERIVDSTGALELPRIPERLLVVGGGIIGLEMATVYEALGSDGHGRRADRPAHPRLRSRPREAAAQAHRASATRRSYLNTKVASVEASEEGIEVTFEGDDAPDAADLRPRPGRRRASRQRRHASSSTRPGSRSTSAARSRSTPQRRTNVSHIYAIGDITGAPMLAHKATHEGGSRPR